MAFSKELADEVLAMPLDQVRSDLIRYGHGTSDQCFRSPEAMRLKLFHRLRIEKMPTDPPNCEGQTKKHPLAMWE